MFGSTRSSRVVIYNSVNLVTYLPSKSQVPKYLVLRSSAEVHLRLSPAQSQRKAPF